jgi:hypothetical protein
MPLTSKGKEIKAAMTKEYGAKKGERVFYASKNAGKISGVDDAEALDLPAQLRDAEEALGALEPTERKNAVDDHKQKIQALRDEIRNQVRSALKGEGSKSDALAELEAKQDTELLVKQLADAVGAAEARMESLVSQRKTKGFVR